MATDNQEYEITYGTLTVGGTTDYYIRGAVKEGVNHDKASVEFEFFYQHQTLASFQTLDDTVRAALGKARMNFTWKIGATTHRSYSHTGYTGMDAEVQIVKDEDPLNTGRSRLLRVRIEFTLPFLGSAIGGEDDAGRKGWSGEVEANDVGRRVFRVSGTYTATAALGSARTVYSAKVAALAAAWLTAIGVTSYNFVGEQYTQNDQNTEVTFVRTYEEILASEAGSANDSDITKQDLKIERQKLAPGDAGQGTQRLVLLTLTYSASIAKANTALQTKWESIRSWLIGTVVPAYQSGASALTDEQVAFMPDDNRIAATLVFEVMASGIVLEAKFKVSARYDNGDRLADIHGKVLDKRKYTGPGKLTMRVETYRKQLRGKSAAAAAVGGLGADIRNPSADLLKIQMPQPSFFGFPNTSTQITTPIAKDWEPSVMGLADKFFEIEEFNDVTDYEFYNENASSSGATPGVVFTG